jgi:hypothetical protein
MSQKSRPVADVSNDGWSPATGYYAPLNEVIPDDSTIDSSVDNPVNKTFVVQLARLAVPKPGQHQLTVRLRKTAAVDIGVTINLLQGNTVIAFSNVAPTTSFQNFSLLLSQNEINQITDYTNLSLSVTAGYSAQVPCCPNALPSILHATQTGPCSSSCQLTYSALTGQWTGTMNFSGGRSKNLVLYCKDLGHGAGFQWYAEQHGCDESGGTPFQLSGTCNPFNLTTGLALSGCCGGADNAVMNFTV